MEAEEEKQEPMEDKAKKNTNYLTRLMAAGGYVLLGVTAILVILIAMKYYSGERGSAGMEEGQSTFSYIIQYYAMEVFILLGALISGHFGLRLLFGANPNSAEVIPEKDRTLLEPLIKESNKDAINQYVVLSSLSGFTGTFQKIGFSGQPLATVTLTLIFSLLSFHDNNFMELTKLTLGAFIGSFVQKGQDQIKLAQEANKQ